MTVFPSVELKRLKKVSPGDLRLLWVNDWYDGPLEAVVDHQGTRCLMVLHHEDLTADKPHRWVLFPLTPDQLAEEMRWHELYVKHVGDHWCFHDLDVVSHPPPESSRDVDAFQKLFRERDDIDLSSNTAAGWTDEMPKR